MKRFGWIEISVWLCIGLWAAGPAFASPQLDHPRAGQTPIPICEIISREAHRHQVPEWFLVRLIWKESSFNPRVVSRKGAQGIARGFHPRQSPHPRQDLGEFRRFQLG